MLSLLRLILSLYGQLPLTVIRPVGWTIAMFFRLLPTRFKHVTTFNISRCLPEKTKERQSAIARYSLTSSAHAIAEAPAIWFGPIARRAGWIKQSQTALSTIRRAHASGRGVILLTPHMGSWELASFLVADVAPLTVLYKPQRGIGDELIRVGRSRGAPISPVPTDSNGVKAMLTALKRGNLVGILPDHDPPEGAGTSFAPFFGIAANTMHLVSKLAARTNAPVFFVVVERLPWARGFRLHVIPAPKAIADPVEGPAALNQGVEHCVRLFPGQYWWGYRRYRRRPPGEPPFYPF